jgi:hypothetical protein
MGSTSFLWHRLLFRAADALAHQKLVSRPTQTSQLIGRKEWMLTEKGFDDALKLCNIPDAEKDFLAIKSYEVEKVVKKLVETRKPEDYDPIDRGKKITRITRESALRSRGFRQAVIESYNCSCAVCGLKIKSPDSLSWEVEAAHIVPNRALGRDDIWNGIAMCRFHHWAFDVGWFTLLDDYKIQISRQVGSLPPDFGQIGSYEFLRAMANKSFAIYLPKSKQTYPHQTAIRWHRQNVFYEMKCRSQ